MKKFRLRIDDCIEQLDLKWKALPTKQQRRFTRVFFIGYAILTLFTFLSVWFKNENSSKILSIGHINNIPQEMKTKTKEHTSSINLSKMFHHERSK